MGGLVSHKAHKGHKLTKSLAIDTTETLLTIKISGEAVSKPERRILGESWVWSVSKLNY
jgi:hypothetical protein